MLKFLQQLFHKSSSYKGHYLGISLSTTGIGFSHIFFHPEKQPTLLACDHVACDSASGVIEEQLQRLVSQYQLKGLPTYISLAPEYYQLMLVDAPEVDDNELQDAVQWRVKDLITDALDDVVIDAFRLASDAYRGRMNMIYTAIINKKIMQRFVHLMQSCQLDLKNMSINELSACAYTQFIPNIDNIGIALVSMDMSEGVINLTENGSLYLSRNISVGLEQLSLPLKTEEVFEKNTTQESLDNLALDIQRSLDYYESQLGKAPIQHIYFLPCDYQLKDMVASLNQHLHCTVDELEIKNIVDQKSNQQSASIFSLGAALAAAAGDAYV